MVWVGRDLEDYLVQIPYTFHYTMGLMYRGKNQQGSEMTNYRCMVIITQNTDGRDENSKSRMNLEIESWTYQLAFYFREGVMWLIRYF